MVARGDGVGFAGVAGLVPLQLEDVHDGVCMHSMLLLIGDAGCDVVLEREGQGGKGNTQPKEIRSSSPGRVACGGKVS